MTKCICLFFAIFGHFLAIFGRFGPFLDREHQKQCNCNLLGATGPTNYINMVSNGYLEIWSVSDPKTNSGAKQDPKLTWGGQNWSFCTLCSPTNFFYTKNVNSEMVTSKYLLAWNRPPPSHPHPLFIVSLWTPVILAEPVGWVDFQEKKAVAELVKRPLWSNPES